MNPYYADSHATIYHGDCRDFDGSADVIITDPPYGLEFMGKEWDRGVPGYWDFEAGWLMAFGGTRTWHRLACGIEDAGWEIRDTIMWLYGQGFPKGKNSLKPAWEPIIVARKYGDLDIDAARIPLADTDECRPMAPQKQYTKFYGQGGRWEPTLELKPSGRWPANLILDEESARLLDEQSGELASGANPTRRSAAKFKTTYGEFLGQTECVATRGVDKGCASRFFYIAKASRSEREEGLLGLMPCTVCGRLMTTTHLDDKGQRVKCTRNDHPTVKPLKVMEYLIILSGGQLILDPFCGSGSTLLAAKHLGRKAIGIEIEERYCEIAANRCRQMVLEF